MKNWEEDLFPTCWSWVRLGDLTTLITKGESIQWQGEQYVDSGIPFIRTVNVTQDGLNLDTVVYVTEASHERMKRSQLQAGDILISIAATLGRCCIVPASAIPANINQDVAIVRIQRNDIDKDYLLRVIDSPIIRLQIERVRQGAGRLHLNLKQLRDLLLPLPPLPEQRRIAAILDKADAVRRKRKEAIALTEELLRSAFLEMFGDPVTNPKGWDICTIGDITDVKTGKTPSRDEPENYGGNIRWVKTTEVRDNIIEHTEEHLTAKGAAQMVVFPENCILVAMYGQGATRGRTALLGRPCATNQACAVILPNERYCSIYLWTLLKLSYQRLRELGRGGNQPNLNLGMVKDFAVSLPPLEKQARFRAVSSTLHSQGNKLIESQKFHDDLFNSLLQRAFRGEL